MRQQGDWLVGMPQDLTGNSDSTGVQTTEANTHALSCWDH
jgi:hypothetical protein